MVKVTSLCIVAASELEFSFGVTAWTEMKIWYVEAKRIQKMFNGLNQQEPVYGNNAQVL